MQPKGPEKTKKAGAFIKAASLTTIGLEMGVCVALGWGIGYFLDGRLGTQPWLMLVFLLLGVAAGFKALITTANKARTKQREADKNENDEPQGPA